MLPAPDQRVTAHAEGNLQARARWWLRDAARLPVGPLTEKHVARELLRTGVADDQAGGADQRVEIRFESEPSEDEEHPGWGEAYSRCIACVHLQ